MEVNKEKWNSKDTVVTRDKAIRHTHTHVSETRFCCAHKVIISFKIEAIIGCVREIVRSANLAMAYLMT